MPKKIEECRTDFSLDEIISDKVIKVPITVFRRARKKYIKQVMEERKLLYVTRYGKVIGGLCRTSSGKVYKIVV